MTLPIKVLTGRMRNWKRNKTASGGSDAELE